MNAARRFHLTHGHYPWEAPPPPPMATPLLDQLVREDQARRYSRAAEATNQTITTAVQEALGIKTATVATKAAPSPYANALKASREVLELIQGEKRKGGTA